MSRTLTLTEVCLWFLFLNTKYPCYMKMKFSLQWKLSGSMNTLTNDISNTYFWYIHYLESKQLGINIFGNFDLNTISVIFINQINVFVWLTSLSYFNHIFTHTFFSPLFSITLTPFPLTLTCNRRERERKWEGGRGREKAKERRKKEKILHVWEKEIL